MSWITSMEAAESSDGLLGKTGDSRSRDMTDDVDGLSGRVMQAGAFGGTGRTGGPGGLLGWAGESGTRDIEQEVGGPSGHRDNKGAGLGHVSGGKGTWGGTWAGGRRG